MFARQLDALIAIANAFLSVENFAAQPPPPPPPLLMDERPISETWRKAS